MTERDRAFDGLRADSEIIRKGCALAWGNLGDKDGQDPQVEQMLDVLMWEYACVLSEGPSWYDPTHLLLAQKFEEGGEACTAAIGFFKIAMSAKRFTFEFGQPLNLMVNNTERRETERVIRVCKSSIYLLNAIRSDAPDLAKALTPVEDSLYPFFGKTAPQPFVYRN